MFRTRVIGTALFAALVSWGVASAAAPADSPVGYWKTIDDDGKTAKSVVRIYEEDGTLHGRIVELINPDEPNPVCEQCKGDRKDQPIVGMEILRGLEKDGDKWSGGRILDPNNGKEYKCHIEVVDGGERLKVRGFIGFSLIGRTQYWLRAEPPAGG